MDLREVLQGRLLFVTGKGGTGKTTLAAMLARRSAEAGRRVVLLEVDNQRPSLVEHFHREPGYRPVEVAPGLSIANVTWLEALAEWLGHIVPVQRLAKIILGNRMVRLFLEVTPGSREVVILDRIAEFTEHFDQVIVDLPASGHAVSFLRVPFTAVGLFPAGPLRRTLERVLEILGRPDTHVLLASLPEDMVVNETIETWQKLRATAPGLSLPVVFLNQGLPPVLEGAEEVLLERMLGALEAGRLEGSAGDAAGELARAGRWERARERATAEALARISAETTATPLLIPLLEGAADASARVARVRAVLERAVAGAPS